MVQRIEIEEYLSAEKLLPIIDVRTPAEFVSGHIPGAINIPLFSNVERAEVGTIYKKRSSEEAYDLGYKFVEPKLEKFISESKKSCKRWKSCYLLLARRNEKQSFCRAC